MKTMNHNQFIEVTSAEGIATLTLNRPPLNVLHLPMIGEVNAALEQTLADEDVAAIVIRAEGRAFCAGVDVADHTAERVGETIVQFHSIFRKLAAADALSIAVVQGAALGGGCELACFCDVVLASDHARLGQPEVQLGVFPPVAAGILPLRVGLSRAIELTALGSTVDAHEALRIGLVNRVFPAETLGAGVAEYLGQIRKLSRPVVRMAKRATCLAARERIIAHVEHAERMYLEELMRVADAHEGVAAFLEKRPPIWQHA